MVVVLLPPNEKRAKTQLRKKICKSCPKAELGVPKSSSENERANEQFVEIKEGRRPRKNLSASRSSI
jgi:hypothetical protein